MNIVLTGGCTGIGKSIATHLRAQGHTLFTAGRSPASDYVVDFTDGGTFLSDVQEVCHGIMGSARHRFGTGLLSPGNIDVLINNAGTTSMNWIENEQHMAVENIFRVNFMVPWLLTRYMAQLAEDAPDYPMRIINVLSASIKSGLRTSSAYVCSKAALEELTRTSAKEFAGRYAIGVFGIAPGPIEDTGMMSDVQISLQRVRGLTPAEAQAYSLEKLPLGRNMAHEEVVKMVDFAVNDIPLHMSGTVLWATGGNGL